MTGIDILLLFPLLWGDKSVITSTAVSDKTWNTENQIILQICQKSKFLVPQCCGSGADVPGAGLWEYPSIHLHSHSYHEVCIDDVYGMQGVY